MKINSNGLQLIKSFEGLRLKAYQDIVGVWTIGYGQTGPQVHASLEISQEQADRRLLDALESVERGVSSLVKVPLSENQFSALVAFSYNVGLGNLKQSTLLNCVNKHEWEHAAKEFLRWNRAGGREASGLTRRRQAESDLFKKN